MGGAVFGFGKKEKKQAEYSIYLVDDDEDMMSIVEAMLESEFDCDFIKFDNANDALKVFSEAKILPDLVISDVVMPDMNGFGFAASLKEKGINIPVIFITGLDGDDVRDDDYVILSKPFSKKQLITEVGKCLKAKS